jgi:MerR family transcriptional regulator, light-induced transcriptional regulator
MNPVFQNTSQRIDEQREALAQAVVERQFAPQLALSHRHGPAGREKWAQDTAYHLRHLSQAIAVGESALFLDYIAWAKVMLARRNVPVRELAQQLEFIREVLGHQLPPEMASVAGEFIAQSLAHLPHLPEDLPSVLETEGPWASLVRDYLQALLQGDRHAAHRLVVQALKQGTALRDLYLHVFQPALYEVGRLWQTARIGVGQEHLGSAITQFVLAQLYPQAFTIGQNVGTLVGATVSGDLHELGMRMVADFFEMEGWHTRYLGAHTSAPALVQSLLEHKAQVLGLSITLLYHLPALKELIAAVRATEACRHVKILVGGYPFRIAANLWRTVEADGSATDAEGVVTLANHLLVSSP